MASKFDGLTQSLKKKHDVAEIQVVQQPRVGRPRGKRSNPDYERLTVLVRSDLRKNASRKWEDEQPKKDMSELVDALLGLYFAGQIVITK